MVPSRAVAADLDPSGALGERVQIVEPGVDVARFESGNRSGRAPRGARPRRDLRLQATRAGARGVRPRAPRATGAAAAARRRAGDGRGPGRWRRGCAAARSVPTWRARSSCSERSTIRRRSSRARPACSTARSASRSGSRCSRRSRPAGRPSCPTAGGPVEIVDSTRARSRTRPATRPPPPPRSSGLPRIRSCARGWEPRGASGRERASDSSAAVGGGRRRSIGSGRCRTGRTPAAGWRS